MFINFLYQYSAHMVEGKVPGILKITVGHKGIAVVLINYLIFSDGSSEFIFFQDANGPPKTA